MNRVDHVAAVVRNLEEAKKVFVQGLGFQSSEISEVSELGMRCVLVTSNNMTVELIEPMGPGIYWRFRENGVGMHHIAIEVEDMKSSLSNLTGIGVARQSDVMLKENFCNLDPNTTSGVRIQLVAQNRKHVM